MLTAVKLKLMVRTFITIRLLRANVFLFPIFRIFQTVQHSKTRHIFTAVFTRIGTRTLSDIDPDAKIIDMSKGMQRQAALILAISTCPRYLLLDEIFDGLDPVVRRLVKKILIDNVSANDMTVVIASHNLRELEELCDRICLIHKGKLLLEREIDEIKLGLRKVQVAFTEVPDNSFFEEINVINLWRNGNIFNLTIRGTEDEFMPKLEERKPLYISAVPMTLEEIFISEMGAAGYDAENII